jgi:uncharacterized alkaline shock family protein YloU
VNKKLGTVRISPGVLATVAQLTALSVDGVMRMWPGPMAGVGRLLGTRNTAEGVKVEVSDESVVVELYVVVQPNVNMLALGRDIQSQVTRAIVDMVGMPVREVNVHIQDVVQE